MTLVLTSYLGWSIQVPFTRIDTRHNDSGHHPSFWKESPKTERKCGYKLTIDMTMQLPSIG